jgi:hypothetical protein
MLFYGPPGTGKTSIMKLVLKISGLTKIVEPFGSSDLNRGLVGETEALIRDIFKRAEYFPYLLCCIIIDEIDSLVPSRESKCLSSSNSSNVNQLLALLSGAADIPNVYLIAATNHLNKIDEAFLRRMQDKYYIGYLNMDERLDLVKSINKDMEDKIEFTHQVEEFLKTVTINFSGAATSELKTKIKASYLLHKKKHRNQKFSLDKELISKLAIELAKTHKITFGSLTIPFLVSYSNQPLNEYLDFWMLNNHIFKQCTGRVNINLTDEVKSIQFELDNQELKEFSLINRPINFIQDSIPLVLCLTIYLKVNFVKIIDSNFFLQTIGEDNGTLSKLLGFYDEFVNYKDGLIIFDADAIIGESVSGNVEDGRSFREDMQHSLIDTAMWNKGILHFFKEKNNVKNEPPKKWLIFITKKKFINDTFKSDLKFPFTDEEKTQQTKDTENKEKEHVCVNCGNKYIEDDNRVDSCNYHSHMLINIHTEEKNYIGITKEELISLARRNKKNKNSKESKDSQENQEIFKSFKYYCCMKLYGESDGCIKNKHSNSEVLINNKIPISTPTNDSDNDDDEDNDLMFKKDAWKSSDKKISFVKKDFNNWILKKGSIKSKCEYIKETSGDIFLKNKENNIFIKLNKEHFFTGVNLEKISKREANGTWIDIENLSDLSDSETNEIGDTLKSDQKLLSGQFLRSKNGLYSVIVKDNCFVIVKGSNQVWSSNSSLLSSHIIGKSRLGYLKMNTDGNLVLYGNDKPIWTSKTWIRGSFGHFLRIHNNGNLVIYNKIESQVWETGLPIEEENYY